MIQIKDIPLLLDGWKRLKKPPSWVLNAYGRWNGKLSTHPYNKIKHFVGKNNTYKVIHGMGGQGEAPIIGWYIKKRKENGN